MKYLPLFILSILLFNCKNQTKSVEIKVLTANEIVDKSIAVSGGQVFDSTTVSINFNFRSIEYKGNYTASKKTLGRLQVIDNDTIIDILKAEILQRYINKKLVVVPDSMALKYKASVNSVHYFSVLPHGLNDEAVNKKLIGQERINGIDYHKIEVTFNENGGGEDFEDVFIYWINAKTFKADFLAYSYNEEDGKGMRFREAYTERFIKGLRFVDYNNYKSEDASIQLEDLGKAFDNESLKLLSKIELENVSVEIISQ